MMYPLVTELAADGIPVTVACGVLKLARAPYYRWLAQPVTDAELVEAYRANALFHAHRDDPEFGYRFLADEAREAGQPMAERTAWRICADNRWWSRFGKRRGRNGKKPGPPIHDDLCAVVDEKGRTRHEFTAEAPNELWIGDITEHWTGEGKLYLVETAKAYGQRRSDLARTQLQLSRGWQMRSPLLVRRSELLQLLENPRPEQVADVFTLLPNALWSDISRQRLQPTPTLEGPTERLTSRLSWIMALAEVLLNEERDVSDAGAEIAARWASSFQEFAEYIPTNPKAKARLRDLSRIRFVNDMGTDLAQAARLSGLTPEQFGEWFSTRSEADFHNVPALARTREVMHLRLSNSDDKWEANDLNDLLYLATAAGYADVLVRERKTANYLKQVAPQVPPGARVFRRMEDAVEAIRSLRGLER